MVSDGFGWRRRRCGAASATSMRRKASAAVRMNLSIVILIPIVWRYRVHGRTCPCCAVLQRDKCDATVKMRESFLESLPDQLHDAHDHPCLVADIRPQVAELRPGDVVPITVEYTEPGEVGGVVGVAAHLPLYLLANLEFLVEGKIGDVQRLAPDVGEPRWEGSQRKRRL